MSEKIKKFFLKKKADARFALAGPGHKLNETNSPKPADPKKDSYNPPSRSGLSDESKQAAAAALARLEGKNLDSSAFNTSLAAIRARVKREVEAEKVAEQADSSVQNESTKAEVTSKPGSELAASGVFFRCPLIGDEILPQEEWHHRIREFLNEQLPIDPGLTAVLMVHSLNKNKEKVQACVETLIKYFENILEQPSEEKYRKIRKSNKVFVDRILPVEGGTLVLEGAGFVSEGDFYVFPGESISEDALQNIEMLADALKSAEPISMQLDRNLQVLMPSQVKHRRELPRDFFKLTPMELKKEQQAKIEAIEKSSMLMTKAMREKEEMRELRNYRFCLIRVKFPDGILLQGTFAVYEPFSAVAEFVQENLTDPKAEFILLTPLGEKLKQNDERTLIDLKLVPATILIFISEVKSYLKPEVVILCQQLESGN